MSGDHHHDHDHEHDGEHDHRRRRGWRDAFSPEAWSITIANFRESELPWPRKLLVAASNYRRKIGGGQECCGNPGQPGC
ncbi:MAG: hypothetical protein OXE02_13145 [Chloroflexi bacterium]|nr:hypothetical protein [Chloroflexota bacterium]